MWQNARSNFSSTFALPVLLAAFVALILYLPSLGSGFVYDAEAQILIDGYIHDPSHIAEVITLRVLGKDVLDASRPAHLLSLMFDSLLWGKHPAGYHFTSILLHALNTGLLCLLALLLIPKQAGTTARMTAMLAALFFAIHPVNTEAVAEVSYREDLLVAFFLLMSLLASYGFAHSRGLPTVAWATGALLALLSACASKETGAIGPFLLTAYAVIFHGKRTTSPGRHEQNAGISRSAREFAPLIATAALVTAGFYLARFGFQIRDSLIFTHTPPRLGGSIMGFLTIQPRLWAFLIKNIAWPVGLSADYTPQNIAWLSLPVALGILLAVITIQFLLARKSPLAAFGAWMFWLGLAPVSNFIPLFRPLADRFLYLPMMGVALMLAGGLTLLAPQTARRRLALGVVALLLIPLAMLNLQRQSVFASPLALWRDTANTSPFSDTAANNLGYALLDADDFQAALDSFQRAWNLTNGKKPDAAAGAALVFEKLGNAESAEKALIEAIKLDARYAKPEQLTQALIMTSEHAMALQKITERIHAAGR